MDLINVRRLNHLNETKFPLDMGPLICILLFLSYLWLIGAKILFVHKRGKTTQNRKKNLPNTFNRHLLASKAIR